MSPAVQEAFDVYSVCAGQIIFAGMGEPVALSIPSVIAVIDLYGVPDERKCFDMVMTLDRSIRAELAADRKRKDSVTGLAKQYGLQPPSRGE